MTKIGEQPLIWSQLALKFPLCAQFTENIQHCRIVSRVALTHFEPKIESLFPKIQRLTEIQDSNVTSHN